MDEKSFEDKFDDEKDFKKEFKMEIVTEESAFEIYDLSPFEDDSFSSNESSIEYLSDFSCEDKVFNPGILDGGEIHPLMNSTPNKNLEQLLSLKENDCFSLTSDQKSLSFMKTKSLLSFDTGNEDTILDPGEGKFFRKNLLYLNPTHPPMIFVTSLVFHSSASEDVIFDPGIPRFLPGIRFICSPKDK